MKKALRIAAYITLATFVFVVNGLCIGYCVLKTNRARNFAVRMALKQMQPIFPGGASIASSEGDLTKGIVLHDVVLNDLDHRPAVKVSRVEVQYALLPLLLTNVDVKLVGVDGVSVVEQPLADGRDNLATMAVIKKPLPKPPSVLPVSVTVEELRADAQFHRAGMDDVKAKVYARVQLSHGMVASIDQLVVDTQSPAVAHVIVQGGVHITPEPNDMDFRHVNVHVTGDTTALRRKVEKLELRGPVDVVATANGAMHDLVATLAVDTHEPRVHVRADAHVLADRAELKSLTVRSPFATVDAHGAYHFDQTGEGVAHIDAPDLRPLALFGAPPMSGAVKLDANAERRAGHVIAHADGKITALRIANNRIDRATLDVDMKDLSGHAIIDAAGIQAGAISLTTAKVNASGDEKQLRATVDAHGPEGLDLSLAAGSVNALSGKKITGLTATLEQLRLRAGGTPWKLDAPARFVADFDHESYTLEPLGLNNDKQHVTVEGKLHDRALADVHVDVKHFDLSQLPALLSPGHVLPKTDVQLTAEAKGPLDRPDAGMKFEGTGYGRGEHDLIHITANGSARLENRRLNGKVFATVGGQRTSAKVDMPFPLRPDEPINASADASVLMLPAFADILVPKVIQNQPIILYTLGTKVMAQVSLSGTTSHPKVNGAARVARWGTDDSHGDFAVSFAYENKQFKTSSTLTLSELPLGGGQAAGLVQATATLPIDLGIPLSGLDGPMLEADAHWDAVLNLKHVDIEKLPFSGFGVVPIVRHGWVDASLQLAGTEEHPKANWKFDARGMEVGGVAGVDAVGDGRLDGTRATTSMKVAVRGSDALRVEGSIADHSHTMSWKNAPLAVSVEAPGFDLGKAQLFKEVQGTLHGSAKITGTWDSPTVVASANVPGLRSGQTTYRQLDLAAKVADHKLSSSVTAVEGDGASLVANLDASLKGGPVSGSLEAKKFRFDFVSELVPALRNLHAQLDGTLAIGGLTTKPKIDGTLALSNGDLTLSESAITYKDVRATLAFVGDAVRLRDVKMNVGTGGSMEGEGQVLLRDLRAEVLSGHVRLHHYPVEWDTTTGVAEATLALDGHREKNGDFLSTVAISDGRVELTDDRTVKGLIPTAHLVDVKVGKARPEPLAPEEPRLAPKHGRRYDVAIKGPFVVHSRELDAQANVDVRLDLSSEIPTSSGHLDLRGAVSLFGKKYDLERGRVLFGNTAQPNLDIRLARGADNAKIGVDIGGSTRQPVTTFWSLPAEAYPSAQVASLVTGQKEKHGNVEKKGLDKKVDGPLSNLIAVSFRQADPASSTVDVNKRQPVAPSDKNKQ